MSSVPTAGSHSCRVGPQRPAGSATGRTGVTVTSLMTKLIRVHNSPEGGKRPRSQLPHPAATLRVYAHVIRAAEAVAADIFAEAVNAA
jgi:hypothetical protein